MPYIPKSDRIPLEVTAHAKTAGELNYLLTVTCLDYVQRHGKSYDIISTVVSALECAKLEFYRRLAAPYEDEKISLAGDLEQYKQLIGD